MILLEQNPVRGYLSTVDNRLFTGLGHANTVDSLQVIWPDDSMQLLKNVRSNQLLIVDHKNANSKWSSAGCTRDDLYQPYQKQPASVLSIAIRSFSIMIFNVCCRKNFLRLGPGMAVGDVNKDGLQDFYVGNGYNIKGMDIPANSQWQLYFKTFGRRGEI